MHRLKNLINDRTVGIVLPGRSVERLKDYSDNLDYCWATINRWWIVEPLLNGKHFDILWASCARTVHNDQAKTREFLDRPEENLWITQQSVRENLNGLSAFQGFDIDILKKIYIDGSMAHGQFNSLGCFLYLLKNLEAKKVVLFGADGDGEYYKKEKITMPRLVNMPDNQLKQIVRDDNNKMNKAFNLFCNLFSVPDNTEILNCSPNSELTIFKKVDYEDLIEKRIISIN